MYPFLPVDLPTGDFFTETESLGVCLRGTLVSSYWYLPRASRMLRIRLGSGTRSVAFENFKNISKTLERSLPKFENFAKV